MKKILIGCLITVLLSSLLACGEKASLLATEQTNESSSSSQSESSTEPHFQEMYHSKLKDNLVKLDWLNDSCIYWSTECRETDVVTYNVFVLNVKSGKENSYWKES
jgi:hypothetical protein